VSPQGLVTMHIGLNAVINYPDGVAGKVTVAHQGDVKAMRTVDNITGKEE
jgi:hypothetical protein